MKLLLVIMFVVFCAPVRAGDLLLGQYTYHFDRDRPDGGEFREVHPLIGYSTNRWTVVYMKNSYDEDSVVAVANWKYKGDDYFRPFVAVGGATGYHKYKKGTTVGKVTFLGYVGVELGHIDSRVNLLVTMTPGSYVGAGLKIKLN